VDGPGGVPQAEEARGHLLGLRLGLGEDDGPLGGLHVEEVGEEGKPIGRGQDGLLLVGDPFLPHHVDDHGAFHVALGQAPGPGGQGGGEEEGLAGRGRGGEEGLHLLLKAHGEHLVRLVQNGDLHLREVQDPLAQVVQGPARGGHHHVGPLLKLLLLLAVARPPVDGDHLEVGGHGGHLRGHLEGELPGGREDQSPGLPAPFPPRFQPLGDGEGEGQGLARARAGLADQVPALEGQGQSRRLDGGGRGDAPLIQGFLNLVLQGKVFELHFFFLSGPTCARKGR